MKRVGGIHPAWRCDQTLLSWVGQLSVRKHLNWSLALLYVPHQMGEVIKWINEEIGHLTISLPSFRPLPDWFFPLDSSSDLSSFAFSSLFLSSPFVVASRFFVAFSGFFATGFASVKVAMNTKAKRQADKRKIPLMVAFGFCKDIKVNTKKKRCVHTDIYYNRIDTSRHKAFPVWKLAPNFTKHFSFLLSLLTPKLINNWCDLYGFLIQFFKLKNCDNINIVCLWPIMVSFRFKIRKSLYIWYDTQTLLQ